MFSLKKIMYFALRDLPFKNFHLVHQVSRNTLKIYNYFNMKSERQLNSG